MEDIFNDFIGLFDLSWKLSSKYLLVVVATGVCLCLLYFLYLTILKAIGLHVKPFATRYIFAPSNRIGVDRNPLDRWLDRTFIGRWLDRRYGKVNEWCILEPPRNDWILGLSSVVKYGAIVALFVFLLPINSPGNEISQLSPNALSGKEIEAEDKLN